MLIGLDDGFRQLGYRMFSDSFFSLFDRWFPSADWPTACIAQRDLRKVLMV